jgi:hypothetical protein
MSMNLFRLNSYLDDIDALTCGLPLEKNESGSGDP